MLKGKKVLIGVTGSIAAYKVPFLVRLLKKEGAEVKVVMTESACDFVTPLTLSTLSQQPVLIEPFNKKDGSWHSHVDWGRWADVFLVAPLSANSMAKMAVGIADNLLTTTYLAAKCPVFFAPAMDLDMFHHAATQKNIGILQSYGNRLIEPQIGELASGLTGAGRMEEPEKIVEILSGFFNQKTDLTKFNVLVTAGPTHESIDPVRFIGNHSSGKMGFAIASELASRGARVQLVTGPVSIPLPAGEGIFVHQVTSASQMAEKCFSLFHECQAAIMSAAVADYTVASPADQKIKKQSGQALSLKLEPTTDILASLGKTKSANQVLVGFALETENEEANAIQKLHNKNADFIVLNSLNEPGAGFGTSTNHVKLIDKSGVFYDSGVQSKLEIAGTIVSRLAKLLLESESK